MNEKKEMQFSEQLDTILLFSEETCKDCGEDSFFCAHRSDSAIVGVFDGCGGLGAQMYAEYKEHTGAYMASRLLSGAAYNWYLDTHSENWASQNDLLESLNGYFEKAFSVATSKAGRNTRFGGSMVRDFPSTASIALAKQTTDGIFLHIIWAGDSRVYLMDEAGLAQLTQDDIYGEDAFSNLYNDGQLSNLLSSDGKYTLNYKSVLINKPTVIFAATDGCFGYLPSPMAFEHTLLESLVTAPSIEGFKTTLKKRLLDVAGDDHTLALMSFFYGTFENMKDSFRPRLTHLSSEYIKPLGQTHDSATIKPFWEKYRSNYERYL